MELIDACCYQRPSNFFVLGSAFLTDMKHQFGFMFTPIFHRVDCRNMGKNCIKSSCKPQCAVTKHSMIINPTSKYNCDIVNFIPSSSSYVRFLEQYDELLDGKSDDKTPRLGSYHTTENQAFKIRFITDRKVQIPPNSMQAVSVIPQEEAWCPKNKKFTWSNMDKSSGHQNILVTAEPTGILEKSALMNAESDQAIYSVVDNAYLIKNHSDKRIQIGSGTAVANCFIIA